VNQPRPRILQVSNGFSYTWDAAKPAGQRVVPGSVTLNGRPLGANDPVRVTVNSFLAAGGDNFAVFKQGRDVRTGAMDIDAFEQYLAGSPPITAAPRIQRVN
jgi:5'-nucleotidase